MKIKILLIAAGLLLYAATYAQKISVDKVPASVQKAFQSKFPSAMSVTWEIEKKNSYEAAFALNSKKMSATFDKDGRWVETETSINPSKLPQAVSQTILKQFPGYTIKEAVQVETPDKVQLYETDLKKGKEILEVQFSLNGEVLKKHIEKKGDENKN